DSLPAHRVMSQDIEDTSRRDALGYDRQWAPTRRSIGGLVFVSLAYLLSGCSPQVSGPLQPTAAGAPSEVPGCAASVTAVIGSIVTAQNDGNQGQLRELVAEEPDFRWFSEDARFAGGDVFAT